MYPKVVIDTDKIIKNARHICELKGANRSLTFVTKLLTGNLEVVKRVIEETDIENIADANIDNLALYRELPVTTWLIREPMLCEVQSVVRYADVSFNSEADTVEQLDSEAKKQGKIHKVILTYELGDLREGCGREELFQLIEVCLKLENISIYGIGANLSCYGAIVPSDDNMRELKELAEEIEERFHFKPEIVSGANTSSMPMLMAGRLPEEINNMRIGEAILCGYNTSFSEPLADFEKDTFILKAQIVEIKNKPSLPRGECLVDAAGEKPVFEDRGIRRRALIAIGNQDINVRGIQPKDRNIDVLGGSSDYTIVDVTDSTRDYRVGDVLEFNMRYMSILKAMMSKFVEKEIV